VSVHGIPIGYTEYPNATPNDNQPIRDRSGIYGSIAMDMLLTQLKELNTSNEPTSYGYLVLWSDGFQRSFVKAKFNSIWILTVTFPDPEGDATSPFHTHCIAIGKSSMDHTPVLDYYFSEIEKLMSGINVYCGVDVKIKHVQLGVIAYITDRPERSSVLQTCHLGTHGKRSLWSAVIDHKHLPYCNRCFNREITNILLDR